MMLTKLKEIAEANLKTKVVDCVLSVCVSYLIFKWYLKAFSLYAIVNAHCSSAITKWFAYISEAIRASNFKIYCHVALGGLYISTRDDVTSYFIIIIIIYNADKITI